MSAENPTGVGLGLRFDFAEELLLSPQTSSRFVEIAPENYLEVGGRRARILAMVRERWPVLCHGLCGDFAGSAPLDYEFLRQMKAILKWLDAKWYSDHLCFTNIAGAEIHDLVPVCYNEYYIKRISKRIKEISNFVELPIAIENVSAYARMPYSDMSEQEFISAVIEAADCYLLLDINNVYVNSINFDFDAYRFIDSLPLDRVIEIHIAGHFKKRDNFLIDTHGSAIIDPVYELLSYALGKMRHSPPILLERDNDIPPLAELELELQRVRKAARVGEYARF